MSFNCFMHERNIYKDRPDFSKIAIDYPEFKKYALPDKKGKFRIDFNDPHALRALTKILLKKDFDLNVEIPNGYLIPTIPQRLNYILWIEDLLTVFPKENGSVTGIDIGTGPCAILSLLGSKKNNWKFVSTETSEEAVQWAEKNIEKNHLDPFIKVTKVNKGTVLQEILAENKGNFEFCVCNPPFFENKDDIRKKSSRMKEKLDLFAKKEEIFSDGGEISFVKQLLKDSLMFKSKISLYSSMFGKKKSFIEMLKELQRVEGITYTKTEFCQGNTIRWGIAWTFVKNVNFEKIERPKPKRNKKPKPPLVLSITRRQKDGNILLLQDILENIKSILLELKIQTKFIKSVSNYAEIEILSYENTWSHQRRRRRKQQKDTVQEVARITDIMLEIQASNTSKTILDAEMSCTGLKQEQATENETISCVLMKRDEGQGGTQYTKPDAVFLGNTYLETEKTISPKSLEDSVCQKRKRDEDEPSVNMTSVLLHDQDIDQDRSVLQENPDCSASPTVKRLKVLKDSDVLPGTSQASVPQKRKRDDDELVLNKDSDIDQDNKSSDIDQDNTDYNTSPAVKKLKLLGEVTPSDTIKIQDSSLKETESFMLSHQDRKKGIQETVQTNHPSKIFETVPLLYCILKLRTTKETISLEMNCPPEFNRETMYQVFQLFRNKFCQC